MAPETSVARRAREWLHGGGRAGVVDEGRRRHRMVGRAGPGPAARRPGRAGRPRQLQSDPQQPFPARCLGLRVLRRVGQVPAAGTRRLRRQGRLHRRHVRACERLQVHHRQRQGRVPGRLLQGRHVQAQGGHVRRADDAGRRQRRRLRLEGVLPGLPRLGRPAAGANLVGAQDRRRGLRQPDEVVVAQGLRRGRAERRQAAVRPVEVGRLRRLAAADADGTADAARFHQKRRVDREHRLPGRRELVLVCHPARGNGQAVDRRFCDGHERGVEVERWRRRALRAAATRREHTLRGGRTP